MPKFKLTPIPENIDRPEWRYSREVRPVYVSAANEAEARELATLEFINMARSSPGEALPDGRPWEHPDLVACREILEIGDPMPNGMVYIDK